MPEFRIVEAKVAAVLTEHEIAINAGQNRDIEVNCQVRVFEVRPVRDPDTHELLGTVRVRKLNLKITSVDERLSVARVVDRTGRRGALMPSVPALKRVTDQNSGYDEDDVVHVFSGDEVEVLVPIEPEPF